MERNHYLSGSFDGLSDGDRDQHHVLNQRQYFKSSFAKSMALETTKSLNFADLDLTGNERYNTVGSHRQANRRLSQRFETNENSESFEFIRKEYKHLQNLYDDLRSKHEKLMHKDANDQAPCIELTLAKSQVDTLQWQLKQVEASNQMYKAVLEQVSKFLEKAHTSLNTNHDKPNLPIKNRPSLKSNRGEYTEKLSLEAYRLYRTVQSIIHTKEPDLVQHLTPCYSTLFEKNSNSSLCSCDSLPAVCNGVKCLEVSSSSSNHSETSIKGSDFFKKETKQKNNVIEDESGFSSISSHDNSNSPTYPELGLPPTGHFPIDKVSRRWSSVSSTPINQSFNYHTTGSSNTSPPIKVCWV
ncbi:uncharacterized protein LOC111031879 isoform X2 [Myzus persicae]|uniref:uncharacterized protein LOC111031879 isoform X2 n=1 Tax=Myzus persicae TaxID=13164 RepID=UPI000B931A8F|nr:uncharacterized protein LOC111031879 isoform X2 [Myzus persicae]